MIKTPSTSWTKQKKNCPFRGDGFKSGSRRVLRISIVMAEQFCGGFFERNHIRIVLSVLGNRILCRPGSVGGIRGSCPGLYRIPCSGSALFFAGIVTMGASIPERRNLPGQVIVQVIAARSVSRHRKQHRHPGGAVAGQAGSSPPG